MLAKYLWASGAIIITILGSTHLYYTFFTDKFSSPNERVIEEMKRSFPNLTKEMTIWKAWISFNATHSVGAMFIGIINLYLALKYFSILMDDHFFFLFTIITILFYAWLALKFWFRFISAAVIIVLICFISSYALTIVYQ